MIKHYKPTNSDLAAFFSGNASTELVQNIESWKNLSDENHQMLDQMYIVWVDTGRVPEEYSHEKYDVNLAWDKVKAKKLSATESTNFSWIWKVAALLLLVSSIGLFTNNYYYSSNQVVLTDSTSQTLTLKDGSHIALNTTTKISYPKNFLQDLRKIEMEKGEAFFDIARDESKPFIIETQTVVIKVLGTSFNVDANETRTIVTVKSGKVSLSKGEEEITLTAGDRGTYNAWTQSLTADRESDPSGTTAFWHTKALNFNGQTLPQVVSDLEKVYGVSISLGNENLKKCRLSVNFKEEPIREVLEIIGLTLGLEVNSTNQKHYTLTGEGCTEN